jgi:Cu/Ag efflux pump CusA
LAFARWNHVPLDIVPAFARPVVEIQTEAPGIPTEEVKNLVTIPVENSLTGIPYLKTVRSRSVPGLSSVRLIFDSGTNLLLARQLVQERLATVSGRLSSLVRTPQILPPLSSPGRCMKIGMGRPRPTSLSNDAACAAFDRQSQMEMTVLSRWTIRPRLMAIPGVANLAIWGEKDAQLQVVVDPDRLKASNVTFDAVLQSVRDATVAGSGGFIDTTNQRLAIRQIPPLDTPEELGEIVVAWRNGAPLQIRDVASLVIDHAPPIGGAIVNSQPGLLLIVEKQPWANTLAVTRGVASAMDELRPAPRSDRLRHDRVPAVEVHRTGCLQTESFHAVGMWPCLVLFLFLAETRSAFISAIVISISLLTAVMVLFWQGGTLNTMVLAGLVIALGEVVFDAIIDFENILRRLRLNARLPSPRKPFSSCCTHPSRFAAPWCTAR